MKEMREALSCIKKNDDTFFLIPNGSSILLPISKEDHSLFLHECLKRYSLFAKKDFKIVPVCFRFDTSEQGVEGFPLLNHLEVEQERLARELACRSYESYLAKLRRLAYSSEAESHGCSLIALATSFEDLYFHYQDSLLRLGKISTYSPYAPASGGLAFIRPLLSFSEESMGKGEKELGIETKGQVRPCPLGKKEKDSFLKATCYGEALPNLPSSKKRETLEDCPDLYFEREGETMSIRDKDDDMVASFKLQEFDAHRVYLSSFFFLEGVDQRKVFSSFLTYWRKRRKAPIQVMIDGAEKIDLDSTWKFSGDCFVRKFW